MAYQYKPKFGKGVNQEDNKPKEVVDHRLKLTEKMVGRIQEMLDSLENGIPWNKPFFGGGGWPINAYTGKRYSGGNVVNLASEDFADPRFMTFKQMQLYAAENKIDLKLQKGSKAVWVQKVNEVYETDENGKPIKTADGKVKPFLDENGNKRYFYTYSPVFNCSQIEGMPPYIKNENVFTPVEEAELLSKALQERTGLKVVHSGKAAAYYSPDAHQVHMPNVELFKTTEGYYDTLLHEFGHSTGKALGREFGKFGSVEYAKEELVAELTSSFMALELGIKHESSQHDNQIAYLKSWLKILQDDPTAIYKAAAYASKSVDYQIEHRNEYVKTINITDKKEQSQVQDKELEQLVKVAPDGANHDKQLTPTKPKPVKKVTNLREKILGDTEPKPTTDKQKKGVKSVKNLKEQILGDDKTAKAKKKKSAELVA